MAYLGNTPASRFTSMDKQTITGNGGTSYTLDHAVGSEQEIEVFVNNVRQEPGSGKAYTVSGTALTMTGNVASTDDFYVVYQGKAQQSVTHPSNSALQATTGTFSGALSATTGTFSGATSSTDLTLSGGLYVGGTGSANYLDDYEEGTWTPIMAGGNATYTTQTGYYTKVGNLVLCIYDITINAIGNSNAQTLSGFPFTAANLTSGPVSYYAGIATNVYSLDSYIINGSINMYFTGHTTASGNIGNALTVFQNSTRIVGAVAYRV